jgi:hypothetical protein
MNAHLLPSLAIASLALMTSAHAAPEADAAAARVTRSAEGPVGDHAADELREPQSFTVTRRDIDEVVTKPRASTRKSIQSAASITPGDSWIYDASTALFVDDDYDGYYRYLRVRLDADTIYTVAYVYAEIYISADGNAWEFLYGTNDFPIWGTDPDDDYEVETELVSGYSTGRYDVLVELYSADTGEFLDEYGPNESPYFSVLPLEDSERDGAPPPPTPAPPSSPIELLGDDGGGGAISWLTLPGLLGALLWRRRRVSAARPR